MFGNFGKINWRSGLVAFLVVANALVWSAIWSTGRRELTVAFLNVGQGDAILIEAPNGNQVLLDGGPARAALAPLGRRLPFYDRTLDLIIASHPDADHIGGLPEVLKRYRVRGFLEPGVESETAVYQELRRLVAEQILPRLLARHGQRIILDDWGTAETADDVVLTILFPDQDVTDWETNEASIIARLTYGQSSFLFTGDAPVKTEQLVLARYGAAALASEVLKVGHHGAKTSTGESFLRAVAPRFAIISAGKNNRYGHPAPLTLGLLERAGVEILRTDVPAAPPVDGAAGDDGTIVFRSDGQTTTRD